MAQVNGMKKLGATLGKASGAAIAGSAVAIGAVVASSVKAYAANEQLIGGVDTLFKENSAKLQGYANEAYKTAK